MGRWLSPDMVNVTEERLLNPSTTLNKYIYGADNPLKYIDQDGQDITYFYDSGGPAGHAVLFAYNQDTGDSAIESFGPASKSLMTRAEEVNLSQVPGTSMFDMNTYNSADDIRANFSSLTIQTTPELAQQVIDYIRQNPDPSTWGVLGPNCSSEVWKILKKFKLDNQHFRFNQGLTPHTLWNSLYSRYVQQTAFIPYQNGRDFGNPRFDMFNLMWLSLPQSKATVTTTECDTLPNGTQRCQ